MNTEKNKTHFVEKAITNYNNVNADYKYLSNKIETIEQDIYDLHCEIKRLFLIIAKN